MQRRSVDFLPQNGEMAARIRAFDWSSHPLGPISRWPQNLKTALQIALNSRFPMWLGWGPQLFKFYNDAYTPVLGDKHSWALGTPAKEVWQEIWEDDLGPQAMAVLERGEASWNKERVLILARSGYLEETYFTWSFSPIPADGGGIGGMLTACTEDTQRIVSERRLSILRQLAAPADMRTESEALHTAAAVLRDHPREIAFALIYLLDGAHARLAAAVGIEPGTPNAPETIALASESAVWPLAHVGAGGQLSLRGLHSRGLPGGFWPEPANAAVITALAGHGSITPRGYLIIGASPRRLLDGAGEGFCELLASGISTLLTNARQFEEETKRAEALEELNRAKTTFFSNVSHEFRTPLTLILGPLEDAIAETSDAKQRERLELLQRSAMRLQKLVNTLLDFSRLEAGRMQASYTPVDLAELTREITSVFRSAVEKAGLRLVVAAPSLDAPIYVDRDMYEKILLNLLSNAFKFTFEGEIEVKLRDVGDVVELTVRDTGTGIAPQHLPIIFERFQRVEGARARSVEGTGIGLALVRELVKFHGGTVVAESVEGKGSTFVVTLPKGKAHLPPDRIDANRELASTATAPNHYVEEALRWVPDRADDATPFDSTWAQVPQPAPGDITRPRIVWADDNADMRNYVTRLLATQFEVEAVADGEAALAAVRRSPPDLVLADVMMPKLDGLDLLRALRADERTRAIPVILLSARAGQEARVDGIETGADDYLVKPFNARELIARVSAHVQMARIRRESNEALRRSEERYRELVEQVKDYAIFRLDLNGRAVTWNEGVQRVLGYSESELIGLDTRKALFTPEDIEAGVPQKELEAAMRCGSADNDRWLRRKNGERFFALGSTTTIKNDSGQVVGFTKVLRDHTSLKRAEEALREADRRKDEFLATMAHELRNPLAPIRNMVEVMKRSTHNPAVIEKARATVERQLNQMIRLVDDLLDVSRIARGKINLRKTKVDVAAVIREAVEAARPNCTAGGKELMVTLPPENLYIYADGTRISQVAVNLLNNACKFTPRGGRIDLVLAREDDRVVIEVNDTGVGIAADQLPHIFDMFSQVNAGPERSGGLGVGLALAKHLTELHGGTLEGYSAGPGLGAQFIVRLPLLTEVAMPQVEQRPTAASPAATKRQVLVVDDNRDAAESLAILLRLAGHEVHVAYDGLEAVDAARRVRPQLILLDIGLPKLDGYEAARRIRAQQADNGVVLVAVTGWGQEGDRRRSREAGFDVHLVKPVDPAQLDALLTQLGEDKV